MTTRQEFLAAIGRLFSVSEAAAETGATAAQVEEWTANTAEMNAAVDAALDRVRSALMRRAIGFEDDAGRFIYSDTAARMLFEQAEQLRGRRTQEAIEQASSLSPPRWGQIREAVEMKLAMVNTDDLDPAAVATVQVLASALDADPGKANLWTQYEAAMNRLGIDNDGDHDPISEALAAIRQADDG